MYVFRIKLIIFLFMFMYILYTHKHIKNCLFKILFPKLKADILLLLIITFLDRQPHIFSSNIIFHVRSKFFYKATFPIYVKESLIRREFITYHFFLLCEKHFYRSILSYICDWLLSLLSSENYTYDCHMVVRKRPITPAISIYSRPRDSRV